MFEASSDVSGLEAADIVANDAKEYEASSGHTISIAQIETVGRTLLERRVELLEAIDEARERDGHALSALMVTDILGKSTDLLVSGDRAAAERALGADASDGVIELPGVISRKKQVAPPLLANL
jgi:manganese-dependent inorganic pyrophosphatase